MDIRRYGCYLIFKIFIKAVTPPVNSKASSIEVIMDTYKDNSVE